LICKSCTKIGKKKFLKKYLIMPNNLSDVKIDIYNIRGEKINSYHQQNLQPGIHEFHWTVISASGATIPSGIYFYTIESNGIVQSKKLIFMK